MGRRIKNRLSIILVVVVLAGNGLIQFIEVTSYGAEISSGELINVLQDNIKFSKKCKDFVAQWSNQEQEAFRRGIISDLPTLVNEVFPTGINASSPAYLDGIISQGLLVSELDAEYNRAEMRTWLMSMKVDLAFAEKAGPRSQQDIQQLRENISNLKESLINPMIKLLPEYFTRDEIVAHLNTEEKRFLEKLNDPFSYELRKPLSQMEMQQIASEFETRLPDGLDRITKRYNRAERIEGDEEKVKYLKAMKAGVLYEISSTVFGVFRKYTTDPDLKAIDPDELVPGYMQTVRQSIEIKKKLDAQGKTLFALRSKQRDQESKHRAMMDMLEPADLQYVEKIQFEPIENLINSNQDHSLMESDSNSPTAETTQDVDQDPNVSTEISEKKYLANKMESDVFQTRNIILVVGFLGVVIAGFVLRTKMS
jgi:predicted ribosome quality control (RQC) complex YloA/Tae2 family protein